LDEMEEVTKITGRVFDEKERPIAGVIVTCDGSETRTLFDGSYKFENLDSGEHTIEIGLEGYRRQIEQVETEEGEETVVDFHLKPELGGAKILGYIIDEVSGEPVKTGGSVYMLRPKSNRNVPIDPTTGYFEFNHLPPGTYTIWTSILEFEDEKRTITVQGSEEERVDLLIKKKEEREVPWG